LSMRLMFRFRRSEAGSDFGAPAMPDEGAVVGVGVLVSFPMAAPQARSLSRRTHEGRGRLIRKTFLSLRGLHRIPP